LPDLAIEDLETFIPGEPARFRVKLLNPKIGSRLTLKTVLNGKAAEKSFSPDGDQWVATLDSTEPRWIHYSVCVSGSAMCSPELVVASPTTTNDYASGSKKFVPEGFMVPGVPEIGGYSWNILEPEILLQDYEALMHAAGRQTPSSITRAEDYGELKRHRWEFRHLTSFAYGILTQDGADEVACVYVNPSKKQGYDASVRFLMTERGLKENLQPVLEQKVREWIESRWPFARVAYPDAER
jgi:hypothetical protein